MLPVAIGVFAVGISLAIAVPQLQKLVRRTRAADIVEDLRGFAAAFESRARHQDTPPPPTRTPGEAPPGMKAALGPKWSQRSPAGHRYLWAPDSLQRGRRYRAVIVLWRDHRADADERRLLEEIDRQIDDGDLQRGKFQLGHRDQPFFVVQP